MKKLTLILFILLAGISVLKAQSPNVVMSAPFDEPEDGWNKVIQLKNGNTFFFHFTKKEGIEVSVYDKSRKLVSTKTLNSTLWDANKMRASVVEGLYEINGEPVVFLHQLIDRTPTLYRISLDANTGAIADEKELGTIPRYKAGSAWAMAYGGVDPSDFFVEKDPESDCYAVIFFNGMAHESGERIKVVHYNGQHKIISQGYYNSPENKFKYLRFIGMSVQGEKSVFVCTYGFNDQTPTPDSRVIVSRLNAGDSVMTHKLLDFTDDFRDTKAIMKYNSSTNMIQLMTLTYLSTKSKFWSGRSTSRYMTLMSYIDPETLMIIKSTPVVAEKVSEDIKANLSREEGYHGLPQDMIINNDHTTTILMEEQTLEETRDMRTGRIIKQLTRLENIGLSELDERGAETEGKAILKSQMAIGLMPSLYLSHKGKGLWSYRGGSWMMGMNYNNNAFLSFDYVNTKGARYILFNDYPENFDRDEKKKRKTVNAISAANTICYKLSNGSMNKYYLFGKPKDDDISKFCYIESSHFLPEQNTYATLLMERDGRKKQARIAWVAFE